MNVQDRDPENPYGPNARIAMETGMAPGGSSPHYDEAAVGLDLPAIDSLIKAAQTDAIATGFDRGIKEASSRYEEIHDRGYRVGQLAALTALSAVVNEELHDVKRAQDVIFERKKQTSKRHVAVQSELTDAWECLERAIDRLQKAVRREGD